MQKQNQEVNRKALVSSLRDHVDPERVELHEFGTREGWLEGRQKGIGASEIAAVLGLSPYKSPFAVWAEKTGKAPPQEDKPVMRRGRDLESLIGDRVAEESGRSVHRPLHPWTIARSLRHPWITCTLDFVQYRGAVAGPGACDAKSVGSRSASLWDDPDDAPIGYQMQIQGQLLVMGWDWGSLAGLMMDSWELRLRDYGAHDAVQSAIVEETGNFWDQHVLKDIPPPDARGADLAAIHRIWDRQEGLESTIGAEFEDLWLEYQHLTGQISELRSQSNLADDRRKTIQAAILSRAGHATRLRVDGTNHVFVLRSHPRKEYTVKATTVHQLKLEEV